MEKTKKLGLSRLGLGTMSMGTGALDDSIFNTGIHTIHHALEHGVNYLNVADFYNHGLSEMIIGQALKGRRADAFVSLKFGSLLGHNEMYYGLDVRPIAVENALCYSLNRLHTDYVDLYQPCRINPNIPIEDTFGAIAKLKEKGLVRHIGITEVDADTLERANRICPIDLVEVEYSIINRKYEPIIRKARKLGIEVVCFNVLMNGLIGGRHAAEKLEFFRHFMKPATFAKVEANYKVFPLLESLACEKGITLAQLAISWVKSQGEDIVALVGSRTVEQMENTLKASEVILTAEDKVRMDQIIPTDRTDCSYMLDIKLDKDGYFLPFK